MIIGIPVGHLSIIGPSEPDKVIVPLNDIQKATEIVQNWALNNGGTDVALYITTDDCGCCS